MLLALENQVAKIPAGLCIERAVLSRSDKFTPRVRSLVPCPSMHTSVTSLDILTLEDLV